jgi:thymidylate synthase
MNKLDKQYQQLLSDIIEFGVEKNDRTGTGTISEFGHQFRHNMSDGFPLLTTKKMAVKTMMTELKWFLKGDTNIKYLVDNGCNIWNGDAFKNYISKTNEYKGNWPDTMDEFIERIKTDDEFAMKWGELGPIYGKQWRDWTEYYVEKFNGGNPIIVERTKDQIANLIEELKTNPDSRRLMVSAWNVGELDQMTLPPCHYGFQCYTTKMSFEERVTYWTSSLGKDVSYAKRINDSDLDERGVPKRKLSLMWNQRSVDTFLGLPFNIASYGTLLLLLCEETGYMAGDLIGNLGDVHLYKNHIEQAKEQLVREPFELPQLELREVDVLDGEFNYTVVGYQSHPSIKAPLSN